MIHTFRQWFNQIFQDPQAILLVTLLGTGLALVLTLGEILTPVLASIVIAYLLEGLVSRLERVIPRLPALIIVYLGFFSIIILIVLVLIPAIWQQVAGLVDEMPLISTKLQHLLTKLSHRFPEYFSTEQIHLFVSSLMQDVRGWGKTVLTFSLSSLTGIVASLIYLILVPFLVFFFLKDREMISNWFTSFLPAERQLLTQVSEEIHQQIGNYVRGKVLEMLILGTVTYTLFSIVDLKYAALLSLLVGVSALIPYVGAVIVTLPVMAIAFIQFGGQSQFAYLLFGYLTIHALDGNVLVPIMFSEAVNLHPVAIVVATLIFGGLWGFWGIFFAIPLATVVKTVIYAWPSYSPLPRVTPATLEA